MLKVQQGFGRKVRLPIPTKDGGLPDDARLITSALVRDQATRGALYLDELTSPPGPSECRPGYQASFKKTWLSLMWGGTRHPAIAGVDRRGDFGGESVLLLNVGAFCSSCRLQDPNSIGHTTWSTQSLRPSGPRTTNSHPEMAVYLDIITQS